MYKPEEYQFVIVDPSLRSSGVLIYDQGEIATYAIQRIEPRIDVLGWYVKHFAALAKKTTWDFLCIEDYSFSSQSRSITIQAEIGGIIRACFSAYHIPIIEMPIQTWKAITGIRLAKNTLANKSDYINAVQKKTGYMADTTDEADTYLMYYSLKKIYSGSVRSNTGVKIKSVLEEIGVQI